MKTAELGVVHEPEVPGIDAAAEVETPRRIDQYGAAWRTGQADEIGRTTETKGLGVGVSPMATRTAVGGMDPLQDLP